jgi:hypothetical protein
VNQYIGIFLLVFAAVAIATFVTGSLSMKKPHFGIPDQ